MKEKQVLDSDDYRFGFGKNWSKFLEQFNEDRFAEGVLHFNGDMWLAVENAMLSVKLGGLFFVAIYYSNFFYYHYIFSGIFVTLLWLTFLTS